MARMEMNKSMAVMQKYIAKKGKGLVLEKRPIDESSDWDIVINPDWNFAEFEYRFENNKAKEAKEVTRIVTIWKDDRNRVYVDKEIFSLLRFDKKLSIRAKGVEMSYYDHLNGDKEDFDTKEFFQNLETSELSSLIMINRFLARISTGIRQPSDKDVASEMRQYLSAFIDSCDIKK